MGNILYQSELRIIWAQKKIQELESVVHSASQTALQASSSQDEAERMLSLFGFVDQVQDETRRLVSEFLLHTRSALDYVIFVLARLNTGTEQDHTQFPINSCKEIFERNRNGSDRDGLRHLTCEQIALVESVQPYNRFPLLELFHKLSNIDKHRQLLKPSVSRLTRQIPHAQTGTEVISPNEMRVNFESSYFIFLVDWEGRDAIEILQDLHSNIAEIVQLFDTSLRL
jgi:hypothetical protein